MSALAGKVCIVTGGSRGMGREFATQLVAAGARVALLARPSSALDEAAAALGDDALAVPCDMADPAQIADAVAAVAARLGQVDTLVANAGITTLMKIETADEALITREIATNLAGPIHCTRAAIPHLRAAGGGDIVYVSSESVRMPYPFLTLYAATKAGLETFSAGMRYELRGQGTRVTILRSGSVASGGNLGAEWPAEYREAFYRETRDTGLAHFAGKPASSAAMAHALLAILTAPRDVNFDLLEARGR